MREVNLELLMYGVEIRKEESFRIDVIKRKNKLMYVQMGMECSGISRLDRRLSVGGQQEIKLQRYSDHLMKSLKGRQKSFPLYIKQ